MKERERKDYNNKKGAMDIIYEGSICGWKAKYHLWSGTEEVKSVEKSVGFHQGRAKDSAWSLNSHGIIHNILERLNKKKAGGGRKGLAEAYTVDTNPSDDWLINNLNSRD